MIIDPAAARLESWDSVGVDLLRERWQVPLLHVYASIASTNDAARVLAEAGAPAGTVVIAEVQTAGRGQRGRRWHAPAGQSVLLSIVLRPDTGGDRVEVGTLPLRIGLAVARAIDACAGTRCSLKWPNDVQIDGRKVAGILCEGTLDLSREGFVVAGIGVNVLQREEDFSPMAAPGAASIFSATGIRIDRTSLVDVLLRETRTLAAEAAPLEGEVAAELSERDALRGKYVAIDGVDAGIACGLSADGALFVRRDDIVVPVRSGTVRPIIDQGS